MFSIAIFIRNTVVVTTKKVSFDCKPNPGILLRAAEKHGLELGRSIMIGDKDSDMQTATKAGGGVRCHYLVGADEDIMSNVVTHKIHLLQEGGFVVGENSVHPNRGT
jgi:histidinol phosphatase-like enzyme